MKKIKIFMIISVFTLSFLSLFTCYDCVAKGVTSGLYLCVDVVIPSLFPVLCVTSCFANSGVISSIAFHTKKLSRLFFKCNGYCLPVFLLSLVSGYPVGASISNQLFKNGSITVNQRNKIALISCSGGPGFIVLAVGVGILGSYKIGVLLLATHIVSSVFVALAVSRFFKIDNEKTNYAGNVYIGDALVKGVGAACNCIISICAFTVLFSTIVNVISKYFRFFIFYKPLVSILEVTNAVYTLSDGSVSLGIISAIIGFGGFSVIFQISSALENNRPPIIKIIGVRGLHALTSYVICNIFMKFFDFYQPVFKSSQTYAVVNYKNFAFSFALLLLAIVFFSYFYKRYEKRNISYF